MAIQKNYIIKHLFFIILALSVNVSAVEFGEIQVNSYLHQPLKAELSIRDLLKNEEIQIADKEAYLEIGIEHFPLYETLKLKNVDNKLVLTSPKKVSQPFLQLLLVIKKEGGEQFRLFTLLLDPADYVYDSKKETKAKEPKTKEPKVAKPKQQKAEEEPQEQSVQYTIKANDTLSEIILKTIPTTDLTLDERMNTVLQENPDAFINNDINRIKIGYTLKIPTVQSMRGGKPAEKTEGKDETKQEETDEYIEGDEEEITSSDGGRVQLSADEPSSEGDDESIDEDTSSLTLENDDTKVSASQSSGLLQIENQNLRQKLTNLEDEVRQLEQKLEERTQQLAQEQEQQAAQQNSVAAADNTPQTSADDEIQLQEEEDNRLIWIVGVLALFVLVIIYFVYKFIAANKQRKDDGYGQAQSLDFSNEYESDSVGSVYEEDELSELSESRNVVAQDEDSQESDLYKEDEQEAEESENASEVEYSPELSSSNNESTEDSNESDYELEVEEVESLEVESTDDTKREYEEVSSGLELEDETKEASEDYSEVENLLNAAKRDIMIGNKVKALSTLKEVLAKGNEEQKKRADELMNHIGK